MKHGNFDFSFCLYSVSNNSPKEGKWRGGKRARKALWIGCPIPLWIPVRAQIELPVGIQHSLLNSRFFRPYEGEHPADSKQCLGHTKPGDRHKELNSFLNHCRGKNSCISEVSSFSLLERPLKHIHRHTALTTSPRSIKDHCYCLQTAEVRIGSLVEIQMSWRNWA